MKKLQFDQGVEEKLNKLMKNKQENWRNNMINVHLPVSYHRKSKSSSTVLLSSFFSTFFSFVFLLFFSLLFPLLLSFFFFFFSLSSMKSNSYITSSMGYCTGWTSFFFFSSFLGGSMIIDSLFLETKLLVLAGSIFEKLELKLPFSRDCDI